MRRFGIGVFLTALSMAVLSAPASAQVHITEVWARGNASTTPDWFELTNLSGVAIDPTDYFMDDDSASLAENYRLQGITNLAHGESAVYLVSWHDDYASSAIAISAFDTHWGVGGAYQVGYVQDDDNAANGGPGLSNGGDTVNLFLPPFLLPLDSFPYVSASTTATFVRNPDTMAIQLAVNGVYGAFNTVGSPTVAGSPGFFVDVVPEPGSIALLTISAVALGFVRRRG
jgi:hypothetical protein